jgi:tetratricopeptide (TPR) repeat protein
VADHFQYLASLGPIALLAAQLARGRERLGLGARAGMAGAGALLALLGLLTLRQGRVYRDEGALWRDTLAKNPASWMAHNNLGHLLARHQKTEEAIRHYREALRLRPGNALLRQGKAAEAEAALRRALAAEPTHLNARNNLSQALLAQGRLNEAVRELEDLIRREPRYAPAHANLGGALLLMGAPMPKAAEHFERALGLDPRLAEARFNLALLHTALGSHAEAIALLREGLRRQPDDRPARLLLAWELATAPDPRLRNGAEALRLAQGAVQEAGPQALHVLAAALAETGRFEEALRTAREAAARAESAGLKEDAQRIREAIARYARGEPMRSPAR